jgi:hypothetical protein
MAGWRFHWRKGRSPASLVMTSALAVMTRSLANDGLEEAVADGSNDFGVGGVGRRTGVDHGDSAWFARGNFEIFIVNASEESAALGFETVLVSLRVAFLLLIASTGAVDTCGHVRVHENGEVGLKVSAHYSVQSEHGIAAKLAAAALVSFGRIGKTIAHDPCSTLKCGENVLVNLLGSRGEHQRQLGEWSESVRTRVENNGPDSVADRCSTRLAGGDYIEAFFSKHGDEALHLGALAAAVEAFKCDELAALAWGH